MRAEHLDQLPPAPHGETNRTKRIVVWVFIAMVVGLFVMPPSLIFRAASDGFGFEGKVAILAGPAARHVIFRNANLGSTNQSDLSLSARDFYYYDFSTALGSDEYWSFECDTVDHCWSALKQLGGPERNEFVPFQLSKYEVILLGPGVFPAHHTPKWDVREIKNGVVYEHAFQDRTLTYYAIDFDRRRVYYHYESGGIAGRYSGGPVPTNPPPIPGSEESPTEITPATP